MCLVNTVSLRLKYVLGFRLHDKFVLRNLQLSADACEGCGTACWPNCLMRSNSALSLICSGCRGPTIGAGSGDEGSDTQICDEHEPLSLPTVACAHVYSRLCASVASVNCFSCSYCSGSRAWGAFPHDSEAHTKLVNYHRQRADFARCSDFH